MEITHQRETLVREVIEMKMRMEDEQARRLCLHLEEILFLYDARKRETERLNRKTSFQFNPLRKIPISETTHSRLLGDLLDPHGSHGQGDLFLQEFLSRIGHEDPRPGTWRVTVETGNVDICLWRTDPASVVIIENKSNWAVDQQNQLYRYWYWNIYRNPHNLSYPDPSDAKRFKVVYMAPSEFKRPAPQSLLRPAHLDSIPGLPKKLPLEPMSFTLDLDLPAWFAGCIRQLDVENKRLGTFLNLYQEIWSHPS